jgi:hypothetical protein
MQLIVIPVYHAVVLLSVLLAIRSNGVVHLVYLRQAAVGGQGESERGNDSDG